MKYVKRHDDVVITKGRWRGLCGRVQGFVDDFDMPISKRRVAFGPRAKPTRVLVEFSIRSLAQLFSRQSPTERLWPSDQSDPDRMVVSSRDLRSMEPLYARKSKRFLKEVRRHLAIFNRQGRWLDFNTRAHGCETHLLKVAPEAKEFIDVHLACQKSWATRNEEEENERSCKTQAEQDWTYLMGRLFEEQHECNE